MACVGLKVAYRIEDSVLCIMALQIITCAAPMVLSCIHFTYSVSLFCIISVPPLITYHMPTT